ncbi:MAG: methylated-DNA--[protein]-cysteine S-methyltransferase [Candidatus Altiarchaeota archaeon]
MSDLIRVLKTRAGWMGYGMEGPAVDRVYLPHASSEELMRKYGIEDGNGGGLRILDELLSDYFSGREADFSQVQVKLPGATEFQKKVYEAASSIPYGETRTYGWVAESIGVPHASRAVGSALKANPIPLIVPCHRVLASDGLGGFTPSLELKKKLLKLEGRL